MWMVLLAVIEPVGVWPYAAFNAVAPDPTGSTLFLGSGAGVWVLQSSGGNTYYRIGEIRDIGDVVGDLKRDPSHPYLFVLSSSLNIYDVSSPETSALLSRTPLPQRGHSLDLEGSLAYLALGTSGMKIMDVLDPSSPSWRGSFTPPEPVVDLDVQDTVAVLLGSSSSQSATLYVLNVSNPDQPTLSGTLDFPWVIHRPDFALRDTFLLVLANETLSVYSIAQPASPDLLNQVPLLFATHLALGGDTAYAGGGGHSWIEGWSGYWLLDLSTLPTVSVLDSAINQIMVIPRRMVAAGGKAFMVDGNLHILEGLQPVGELSSPGWGTLDLAVYPSRAYLSEGGAGIELLDLSYPAWPRSLGRWFSSYGGNMFDLSIHGTWLFSVIWSFDPDMGYFSKLVALDVRDTSGPAGQWSLDPYPLMIQGYAVSGNSLFVVLRGDSLVVFSLESNPPFPLRAEATLPFPCRKLEVRDTLGVAVAGTTGVGILSLSDPEHPQLLSVIHTGGEARTGTLFGNLLYIADGTGGLQVYSLVSPTLPIKVAHLPVPAEGIELAPPYGVIWNRTELYLLDVSDPANPRILNSYSDGGEIQRVAPVPPYLYLARRERGMAILHFTETGVRELPHALVLRPDASLPHGVRLVDLLGRPVRRSYLGPGFYVQFPEKERVRSRKVVVIR